MNSVRYSYAPFGGSKIQSGRFFVLKIGIFSKKVCYKVSLCDSLCGMVVKHPLAYVTVHKWLVGMSPSA